MCVSVSVCVSVYVWGRRSWEKRVKKEKRKSKEREKKRVKKEESYWREKDKLIHTDKQTDRQTDRQTDGQIDRHKSFIDMRYYTEQYSKSNRINLK